MKRAAALFLHWQCSKSKRRFELLDSTEVQNPQLSDQDEGFELLRFFASHGPEQTQGRPACPSGKP